MAVVAPVDELDQHGAGLRLVDHVVATVSPTGVFRRIERWLGELEIVAPTRWLIMHRTFGWEVRVAFRRGGNNR